MGQAQQGKNQHLVFDDLIRMMYERLNGGECASLVGIGTSGKTHFVRRVQQEDAIQRYAQTNDGQKLDPGQILFVTIDPNAMVMLDEVTSQTIVPSWPGFEIILSRLFEIDSETDELGQYYKRALRPTITRQATAFRHVEGAIDELFEDDSYNYEKIIIILDEFELLFEKMPASFFINLRSLRDSHRYRLMYMTISRTELFNLPDQKKVEQAESFLELFREYIYMRPLTIQDAKVIGQDLVDRLWEEDVQLSDEHLIILLNLSGGFSGMLRTCIQVFRTEVLAHTDSTQLTLEFALARMMENASVLREVIIMFKSLPLEERTVLELKATGKLKPEIEAEHELHLLSLESKGVLRVRVDSPNRRLRLFQSRLLEEYLKDRSRYDRQRRRQAFNPAQPNDRPNNLPR